jgi:hypothetical protein
MRKTALVYWMAAGLALLPVSGAFSAANPGAPNPYPNRESKLLADFETDVSVTADPEGSGTNRASIITDTQFAAEGGKALKVDLTGLTGWNDPAISINFQPPIDIQGYQVVSMDIFVPADSVSSWHQFHLQASTTTSLTDDSTVSRIYYGPGAVSAGWNHMIWVLKNGTDTKLAKLELAINSGAEWSGPVYFDNIRIYKGNFLGLQPDELLVTGFDKAADKDLFAGDTVTIEANTDKQFISQGEGSLKIDMTGFTGGSIVRAEDFGTTIDASKATAVHLDLFVPTGSYTASDWHEVGFGVIGEGGEVSSPTHGVVDGQWVTLEIPLTPEKAAMLTNIKGVFLSNNSGSEWAGPVYIDNLRVVVPTQTPPAAGE